MSLTVREVLALDAVQDAAPDLLSGTERLDEPVRWVHSSEIFEMAPLLTGRELLLTTGLGIVHADAGTRRHYLRELVARDIACLALEVGRSFREVPDELVDEAAQHELPLVALRRVVPFIRICEEANSAIVNRDLHRLRLESQLTRLLDDVLAAEPGVTDILDAIASTCRLSLALVASSGSLVATAGGHHEEVPPGGIWDSAFHVGVSVRGHEWGRLYAVPPPGMGPDDAAMILDRAGAAIGLTLLATGRSSSDAHRQAEVLLADLLETFVIQRTDFVIRSHLAGFHSPASAALVGVAVDAPEVAPALAVLERAARHLGTSALCGIVQGDVVGVLSVSQGRAGGLRSAEAALREVFASLGKSQVLAALGAAVSAEDAPAAVASSLRQALDALHLVLSRRQLSSERRPSVVTSHALALELEMLRSDRSRLMSWVDQVLGPLVRWDEDRGSNLVPTLETYLRLGCSASRAASALHLARASMYERLDRIETLLGIDVRSPQLHATLVMVTCAHRLLRGGGGVGAVRDPAT